MNTFILISVAIVWCIAVITPGPNFFITVQTAIEKSHRSALFVVLGISSGTLTWAISGFVGINFLFKTVPWIYFFIKLLGGSYLIFIGIKLIVTNSKRLSEINSLPSQKNDGSRSFKLGFLTSLSNPKTGGFMASLFAATMPPNASYLVGITSIALIFLISICWYMLVAYIFSLDQFRNVYQKIKSWIERVAGAIFIGFGVKLATQDY
jgi:RhtB (resistance to homoserine/threonine) family protein